MKVNMPITNVEHSLRDGQTVVSRTDLKGVITYVNQDFIEISGFTEDELIGKSQNVVRHPDMPPAAFADLWSTIKSGRPWRGLVKNRCKNGDFYWVDATVTLVKKDGQTIGYQSVRRRPTTAQIAEAEKLYKAMNEGKTAKLGKSIAKGGILKNLSIKSRLIFVIAILSALLLVIGVMGLSGMSKASDGLKTVYEDRTVPLGDINMIIRKNNLIQQAVADALLVSTTQAAREHVEEIKEARGQIAKIWDAYMATYLTPEEAVLAKKFAEARGVFASRAIEPISEALLAGKFSDARRMYDGVMHETFKDVRKYGNELAQLQLDIAKSEYEASQKRYNTTRAISIAAIVIGLVLAAWIGFALIRAIVRPLNRAIEVANAVADGDLTSRIETTAQDETGRLMQALHDMNVNLITLVGNVRNSVDVITTGTAEIATGNSDLSQRTEEQASSLEETASSMEELTSTVKQNAENAKQANQLARGASDVAVKGGDVVGKVVTTMSSINDSSKKIVDIISVIEGIAFQTNILALNAAVEAARAGEQGRGFAVVASEVRNLAQRSAAAAKEIKTLIGDSVSKVEDGTVLVDQAGKTMEEIVSAVRRVTDIMAEISAASAEQSSGIEQVNQAVMQMDNVTQQNAALVEEAAAAAESLEEEAQNLSQTVSVFKLDSSAGALQPVPRHEKPKPAATPVPKAAAKQPVSRKTAAKPKTLPAKEEGEEWKEF